MRKVTRKKVYPTRESESPDIKRSRLKKLRWLVGHAEDPGAAVAHEAAPAPVAPPPPPPRDHELATFEYVMLAVMYGCGLHGVLQFADLAVKHGVVLVAAAYVVVTVAFAVPLHMLLTFLGAYSKRSYLTIFACAPVFEGLGYVIAVAGTLSELYNAYACGAALLVVFHCVLNRFGRSWCAGIVMYADGRRACVAASADVQGFNFSCEKGDVELMTATQTYIATEVMKVDAFSDTILGPTVNLPMLYAQVIVWTLIFVLALTGVRRLKTVTIDLQWVCGFLMTAIFILVAFHGKSRARTKTALAFADGSTLLSFDFWAELAIYTVGVQNFGALIWLATLKPKSFDPKFAVMLTTLIRVVIFVLSGCMTVRIYQDTLSHFMIADPSCLPIKGVDVVFSLIPEALERTGLKSLLVPVWYSIIFYLALITPAYTVMGLVDSINQKFRASYSKRLYVCAGISIVCFACSVILATDVGPQFLYLFKWCSISIVFAGILLFINVAFFFGYSTRNILDDYSYTYGAIPEKYWTVFWNTSPIFGIFAFIFVAYNQTQRPECTEGNYIVVLAYLFTISVFLPFIVIGITRCCFYVKTDDVANLSKPDSEWGPFAEADRAQRKVYFPEREMKYRTLKLRCKHKCCCSMYEQNYLDLCKSENAKMRALEREYNAAKGGQDPKEVDEEDEEEVEEKINDNVERSLNLPSKTSIDSSHKKHPRPHF